MKAKKQIEPKEILRALTDLGYGQSESESHEIRSRRFHPIRQHLNALREEVALIVGDRGVGKSALFKATTHDSLYEPLQKKFKDLKLPPKVTWLVGYEGGKEFADAESRKQVFKVMEEASQVWYAYLVRLLSQVPGYDALTAFKKLAAISTARPRDILNAFDPQNSHPAEAMDELDTKLKSEGRWLFVSYDELDTLGGFDWDAQAVGVRGLLAFWTQYARRWERIRPKIFLRSDLFRRYANVAGADLAKLAASRVELIWSRTDLLAMLTTRMLNSSKMLHEYCIKKKIRYDSLLGAPKPSYYATDEKEGAFQQVIEGIFGEYMGEGPKKGKTFSWLFDHLGDSNRRITPRNLVRLIEISAEMEQSFRHARHPRIIHYSSLRTALNRVSDHHVKSALDEWPWLEGLEKRLQRLGEVPWMLPDLKRALKADWLDSWSSKKAVKPPESGPDEFVEYLLEVGIIRFRSDKKFDVTDLYLHGLGLKRRGGVKLIRPQGR